MTADPAKPRHARRRMGWIGLLLFILVYLALFLIGRYSPTYEPDPIIDGRRLSEWTDDLKSPGHHDAAHSRAVDVLKSRRSTVLPVLIEWLEEKDTFPQLIYFGTMITLEGKTRDLLDYRGAYFNQLAGARALACMGENDPTVIAALEGVVEQYKDSGHYAGEVASQALGQLKD